jgi:hypothetical protein
LSGKTTVNMPTETSFSVFALMSEDPEQIRQKLVAIRTCLSTTTDILDSEHYSTGVSFREALYQLEPKDRATRSISLAYTLGSLLYLKAGLVGSKEDLKLVKAHMEKVRQYNRKIQRVLGEKRKDESAETSAAGRMIRNSLSKRVEDQVDKFLADLA